MNKEEEEIKKYSKDFHEEIHASAIGQEAMREETFTAKMGEILDDNGETEDIQILSPNYKHTGLKVDGYNYNDELNDFTMVISHYTDKLDPYETRVTNTDIKKEMNRVTNFFEKSLNGSLYSNIEQSHEAHDLSKLIYEVRDEVDDVKFILLTDGLAPKHPSEEEKINNIDVKRTVWDIERTYRYEKMGEKKTISIDFAKYCDGSLACVEEENINHLYTTYLAFIPGNILADMYDEWGTQMLDMNVRLFLSARGNVNKGLRDTVINSPEMFCAYNNGITVYANNVELNENRDGIIRADDFQIVNGGQTTASLYHARKKFKAELDNINVQMKLTVIHKKDEVASIVPLISQFSNTQNRVQIADFYANEKPHPEIDAVSRQIAAPDPTGGALQTYWFYERARGGYEEFRNLTATTPAKRREFDTIRPKNQKFDKLIFGKVWNTYLCLPYVVGMGAQKSFARFNVWLREQEGENWESFFRKTVALLILWKEMEKITRRNNFVGYRANLVAYTLSWFMQLTDKRIDLEKIWQKQKGSEVLYETLNGMTFEANEHIRDTELNVTEYCKKEDCWEKLKSKNYPLPPGLEEDFISSESTGPKYKADITAEKENIEFCEEKGSDNWFALAKWLKERDFLPGKARSQCFNMGRQLSNKKRPSAVLSFACRKAWQDAVVRGWKE